MVQKNDHVVLQIKIDKNHFPLIYLVVVVVMVVVVVVVSGGSLWLMLHCCFPKWSTLK